MDKTEKNGYFLTYVIPGVQEYTGANKKIKNQIRIFNQSGLQCEEIPLQINDSKIDRIKYRIPLTNSNPKWDFNEKYASADFIYFRKPYVISLAMRSTLKKIKKNNHKIKIVMELPTYPYDDEYKDRSLSSLITFRDQYARNRMEGSIDRIATLTDDQEIFGIPTLRISNGIIVDDIKKREPSIDIGSEIHICAVACFSFWHGYERFIDGLSNYYVNGGKRNIICHFVGDGSEVEKYKEKVKECKLEKHCLFHGFLKGKDLDEIYNLSSLALGSLGAYKKGLVVSYELKSREAVARGIPMVTGCKTDIFREDIFPYYLEYNNDPTPIDVQRLVSFYDHIYQDGQEKVIEEIRTYAYKTVGMDTAMKRVIDYLNTP